MATPAAAPPSPLQFNIIICVLSTSHEAVVGTLVGATTQLMYACT